jgi:hypothetical protein
LRDHCQAGAPIQPHIFACRNRFVLQRSSATAYAAPCILSGTRILVQPRRRPQTGDIDPILSHLVEAREAAIHAGLSSTIDAIERAIILATMDFSPRRSVRCFHVINGMKSI